MPRIVCDGRELKLAPNDNLLDALLAAGLRVASSCRAGACQACLVQATRGTPPARAQQGLKDAQRLQGYFLACQAVPTEDLELSLSSARALDVPARITSVEALAADVLRVLITPRKPLQYCAGQYVTLTRTDGLARAYSIASPPSSEHACLELHVRVIDRGQMSGWLGSPQALGAEVTVRGPMGECFYVPGNPEQPLLLAGTGTGLAPLWGIVQDALASGHTGPIELWHGARTAEGLYLVGELEALASTRRQLTYRRCVLQGTADARTEVGSLDAAVLASAPSFEGRRVFLCGDPNLVSKLKRQVFLRGASLRDIHADAFVGAAPPLAEMSFAASAG
jgi:CDP-4-dehydro-6-deoxyglucose reductase, E3